MIVLALDPGSAKSGYAVWDGTHVIDAGVQPNEDILTLVGSKSSFYGNALAIEKVGHYGSGMAVGKTVFDTCIWTGRFIQRWEEGRNGVNLFPYLILRATVKTHICGSPRANDSNVAQALRDRLGGKGTSKNKGPLYGVTSHSIQALAVAVYFTDMERIGALEKLCA